MFGQTEEVAEQVIPERDVLKCEQWEIGDKIMEQQCSLSLSRSAVGWDRNVQADRVRGVFMSRLCPFCPSRCQGCAAPLCLL